MQHYSNTGDGSLSVFKAELVQRHLDGVLAADQPELIPEPVKLAGTDVEGLIVECSEQVRAMAWKFVRNASRLEFDDMYSVGMIAVCEAAPLLKEGLNPFPYLCRAAKYAMIDEYERVYACSTVSLDAPLSHGGSNGFCLADTLSDGSTSRVLSSPTSRKRVRALHDALMRLSARQRAVLRRRYGLPGYGAHSLGETARALRTSTTQAAHCLDYDGRRKLRADARLCKVMGVQA